MTHSRVLHTIHNPRYAGAFFFGRHRNRRRPDGGYSTVVVPRDQWTALIPGAHPGYITWDNYEANQARLAAGAQAQGTDRRASPPREGNALLQGIVVCARCGRRMTVRYKTYKGATQPYYVCQSKGIATATPICQNVPGALIDHAVGQLLLQTLTPLAIEVALSVQGELDSRAEEADRLRKTHVQRAAQLAELARRRYLAVDPDNRLVADTLEADWNDALRQLAAAQDDYQRQHDAAAAAMSDAQRAQVLALAGDFPALWNDPATPQRERKRMVRLLIDDVTLDKTDAIAIHVRLKGGQTATLSTPIPPRAWEARQTPPEIIAEIDRLLDHHTDIEIAEILNQKGLRSGDRKPFHRLMIRNLRESYQLRSRYDRLRDAGMLTLSEIADHLGLSTATIKSYRLEGLLAAHAYNDKNECLYPIPDKAPNKQTGRPPKNGRPEKEPSQQP